MHLQPIDDRAPAPPPNLYLLCLINPLIDPPYVRESEGSNGRCRTSLYAYVRTYVRSWLVHLKIQRSIDTMYSIVSREHECFSRIIKCCFFRLCITSKAMVVRSWRWWMVDVDCCVGPRPGRSTHARWLRRRPAVIRSITSPKMYLCQCDWGDLWLGNELTLRAPYLFLFVKQRYACSCCCVRCARTDPVRFASRILLAASKNFSGIGSTFGRQKAISLKPKLSPKV